MNLDPVDFNYIDGENIYPLQDYIDNIINNDIYTSNIYITSTKKLDNVIYYNGIDLTIQNSTALGQIHFKTSASYPNDTTKVGTIIDFTGKLKFFHNYNILQPVYPEGYYEVGNEIMQLKADGINTDLQITALEAGGVYLQEQITLVGSMLGLTTAKIDALIAGMAANDEFEIFEEIIADTDITSASLGYETLRDIYSQRATFAYNRSLALGVVAGVGIGLGGAVLGYLQTTREDNMASNLILANIHLTDTEKQTIFGSATAVQSNISNIHNFNVSMSNLVSHQGFINCNVITTQTIPLISTSNITINYSSTGGHIKLYNTNSNANTAIVFNNNAGIQSYIGIGGTNILNYANNFIINSASGILFSTGGQNNLIAPSMCITNTGATGLSAFPSTIPTGYRFYVNGNSYFNGSITATNIIYGGVELSNQYLKLSGGTLTGALVATSINCTSLTTNSIIYNTQQLSTTLNNYLLLSGGTLTDILTFNTGLYGDPAPSPGGFNGDRIVLQTGIGTNGYPYSVGINTDVFWNCAPATASYKWYSGASNTMILDNTGQLQVKDFWASGGLTINGNTQLLNYSCLGYPYYNFDGVSQTAIFADDISTINLILSSVSSNYGASVVLANDTGTSSFMIVGGSTTTPNLFRENLAIVSMYSLILNGGNHATETPDFIIDSSGNVGIGTTANSSYKLLTNGEIKSTGLTVDNANGAYLTLTASNPAVDTGIYLYNTSAPGVAGYIGIGGTTLTNLVSRSNLTITSKNSIVFNNFSSPNASLIILQNGNIGIGNSTPKSLLSFGNATGYKILSLFDNNLNNNFQFVGFGASSGLCFNNFGTGDAFQFRVGASTTSATEVMRINGDGTTTISGNVGIRTSASALYNLDIYSATGTTTAANGLRVYNGSSHGYVTLSGGTSGNPGYINFFKVDGNRAGYIGYTNLSTFLDMTTENGYVGYRVTGNFYIVGRCGIGITSPNCKLYISAGLTTSATCFAARLSSGASADNGGFGTLLGLGSEPNGWSKCAIGHTRMGAYDVGDIIFLCRTAQDATDCTMSDERMRIASGGNVGIGTNLPKCKLQVYGGTANITNNNPYAVPYGKMQAGSLTIGDGSLDYGNAYYPAGNWSGNNTAGLLLECLNNTEIAVHDVGNRLVSLMNYIGGPSSNVIQIGRDMGWNSASLVELKNNTTINGTLTTNQFSTSTDKQFVAKIITIYPTSDQWIYNGYWKINFQAFNNNREFQTVFFSCSHYFNATNKGWWSGHIFINSEFSSTAPTMSFYTITSSNMTLYYLYDGSGILYLQIGINGFYLTSSSALKYKVIG